MRYFDPKIDHQKYISGLVNNIVDIMSLQSNNSIFEVSPLKYEAV